MNPVYIVEAKRSAIGSFGGALKGIAPVELGTVIAKAALSNADIDPNDIGLSVFGQVISTDSKDPYLARVIALRAGLPNATPATTLNRLCGSGMQAIVTGAQQIQLGETDLVLAGGVEIMSRAPHSTQDIRWGKRLGRPDMRDMLEEALTDPFHAIHMGETAENVAEKFGVDRETQDACALESHRRASRAIREGRFRDQIVTVEIRKRRETVSFSEDEHVRHDARIEDFQRLRAIFRKDGSVTAGNASGINDGASVTILASEQAIADHNLTPMARLVSAGHAGVDPKVMGIGPVPATRQAITRADVAIADFDVIESNEAFAAQACAVSSELGFDPEKVNPNGSGISLGHPIGATGAINVTKLVHELIRTGGKYGLATMCIGGGQGISTIWERVS